MESMCRKRYGGYYQIVQLERFRPIQQAPVRSENRPYRKAMSRDDAVKTIMNDSNSKWSAKLANEFVAVVKEDFAE